MGFFGQEYWSGLSCPSPMDPLDPEIELMSPALASGFLTLSLLGCPKYLWSSFKYSISCNEFTEVLFSYIYLEIKRLPILESFIVSEATQFDNDVFPRK